MFWIEHCHVTSFIFSILRMRTYQIFVARKAASLRLILPVIGQKLQNVPNLTSEASDEQCYYLNDLLFNVN